MQVLKTIYSSPANFTVWHYMSLHDLRFWLESALKVLLCHGFAFSSVVLAGVEFILFTVSGMRIYELVFWIYDRNSVDNAELFPLLLSSADWCQSLFCLSPHHWVGWGCTRNCVSWDSWPQVTTGMSHTIWCHVWHKKWGRRRKRDGVLPSQFTITFAGIWLSWCLLNTRLPIGSSEVSPIVCSFCFPN